MPIYPEDDLNKGALLLRQLGSFWTNVFEDKDKLQAFLRGSAHEQAQTHINLLETIASLSRFTVPVFHTENWYLLTIKLSDALNVASKYQADDLVYGPQDGSVVGRTSGFIQNYGGQDKPGVIYAPLPDTLADCPFTLQNLAVFPSKVWVNGVDYDIDKASSLIRFRDNPFLDPLVAKQDLFDSVGQKIDEEIAIWVYKGQFDLTHIYTHFGYAIGLKLESSSDYKNLMNSIWDMYLEGGSVGGMQTLLAAMAGVPTVIDPEETVEVVYSDPHHQVVITNTRVYKLPLGSTVLVAVGDVVNNGDVLCDAFQVSELSKANPDYSILPAMSLSPSFLSGSYTGELMFRNATVTLDYLGLDEDNRAIVRFETLGYPGDVEDFWDFVHAQGKLVNGFTDGKTLANLLDQRVSPTGEPAALALPTTVNPMQFVIENLMRNNLFLIKIKLGSLSSTALGLEFVKNLRAVIPPHTAYIVYVELSPDLETIDLTVVGDEDEPGVQESTSNFTATSTSDSADEVFTATPGLISYQDGDVILKYVSINCQ